MGCMECGVLTMKIKSAKYLDNSDENCSIKMELSDGEIWSVPMVVGNSDYDEIMRQVDAGELTIEPADEE